MAVGLGGGRAVRPGLHRRRGRRHPAVVKGCFIGRIRGTWQDLHRGAGPVPRPLALAIPACLDESLAPADALWAWAAPRDPPPRLPCPNPPLERKSPRPVPC